MNILLIAILVGSNFGFLYLGIRIGQKLKGDVFKEIEPYNQDDSALAIQEKLEKKFGEKAAAKKIKKIEADFYHNPDDLKDSRFEEEE